jgi:Sec-independent protein translocase protein TatA
VPTRKAINKIAETIDKAIGPLRENEEDEVANEQEEKEEEREEEEGEEEEDDNESALELASEHIEDVSREQTVDEDQEA